MMDRPVVSVHMITYNHQAFIRRAIEGVLKQNCKFRFELVIGEDCSTDGTMEVIQESQRQNPGVIRIVSSDRNVGLMKNFYRTYKACRGKYVAFCEGDDYWHDSQKLEKQVDYMEAHPSCGMVFSDFDVYHARSGKQIKKIIETKGLCILKRFAVSDFVESKKVRAIITCTTMVRRELSDILIDADPRLYQDERLQFYDLQLWAEICSVAEIGFIPESLATYQVLDDSVSNSRDRKKQLKFSLSGTELRLYLCTKYKLPERFVKEQETAWCDYSLQLAFHERNAALAEEVRRRQGSFTWKQWLRYLGAKSRPIQYAYRAGASLLNLNRRNGLLYWDE
jgi:glycosyltransferase involved in cell wall biosynthesis